MTPFLCLYVSALSVAMWHTAVQLNIMLEVMRCAFFFFCVLKHSHLSWDKRL